MEKEKQFIVCPACGSTDMRWLLGGKLGDQYKCAKCDYQGIGLKGNEEFANELREKRNA